MQKEVIRMKEELVQICIELHKWSEKYDKKFVSAIIVDGNILANVETTDEDYKHLNIFIQKDEVNDYE